MINGFLDRQLEPVSIFPRQIIVPYAVGSNLERPVNLPTKQRVS